jgi:plastocyanin
MNVVKASFTAIVLACLPIQPSPAPGGSTIRGRVILSGNPPKLKPLDLSKEPACVKMHAAFPLFAESVLIGSDNSLRNVVVYISSGELDSAAAPMPPVMFEQQGCHYTTHVLAIRVGQEVKISNDDSFSHNIHPLAKINREWNKMQPPGTPPFSYAFDHEEFIPVKCNIHPWMQGYFVVLKTSHFAVTDDDGRFALPNLPPGHYVVSAWHEVYGTQTREITIGNTESQSLDFTFTANP